jgi:hypothetical protein
VKFTAAALTRERQGAQKKEGGEPLHDSWDCDSPMHTVLLRCAYMIGEEVRRQRLTYPRIPPLLCTIYF